METNSVDFSGVALPFSVTDLISSGSQLLAWVAGFVLLGLAFALAPKFISLIVGAFKRGAGNAKG